MINIDNFETFCKSILEYEAGEHSGDSELEIRDIGSSDDTEDHDDEKQSKASSRQLKTALRTYHILLSKRQDKLKEYIYTPVTDLAKRQILKGELATLTQRAAGARLEFKRILDEEDPEELYI